MKQIVNASTEFKRASPALHIASCEAATENLTRKSFRVTVMRVALLALVAAAASAQLVRNVPYHRQFTDYACGDASVEMVLHKWASPDVDQRAIIDVMRTTENDGTSLMLLVVHWHVAWMCMWESPATALVGMLCPAFGSALHKILAFVEPDLLVLVLHVEFVITCCSFMLFSRGEARV